MNRNLPLLLHGLHGMWSRAGSPLAGLRPRGSSLCLLLLALITFLPQNASAALPKSKDLGWETSGIYTHVDAWADAGLSWQAEKYIKFTHRTITAAEPYIEFEFEFHVGTTSMCAFLLYLENGNKTDIPILFTNRYFESTSNTSLWQTKNTDYGACVWVKKGKTGANGNSEAWVGTMRFYPTRKYYELADRALYLRRYFDQGNNGGDNSVTDFKNNTYKYDVVYTHNIHPQFGDGINAPTVTRTAPGTIKVDGSRSGTSGNYSYVVTAGGKEQTISMGTGLKTGSTTFSTNDGTLNAAFNLTYAGYTVISTTLPTDILNRNLGSVDACSAYQGNVTITGHDYTYPPNPMSMSVAASTKAKEISSLNWKKCEKQIIVSWDVTTGVGTDGTWGIYRSEVGSNNSLSNRTYLTSVEYDTRSYTDTSVDYEKTYRYEVAYLPKGTSNPGNYSSAQLTNLSATKDQTTTRSYKFTKFMSSLNADSTKLVLNWEVEEESTNPKIYIDYRIGKNGTWTTIGSGYDFATTGTITPNISYATCESYFFRMRITSQEKEFVQEATGASSIGTQTTVTDLVASKGSYAGMVRLTWDVSVADKVTPVKFVVSRRIIGTDTWGVINTVSGTATTYSYEDNTALPGEYYEYKVECYGNNCDENNISVSSQQMRYGFAQSTGTLSGRITYEGGTAVPDVTVRLVPTSEDAAKQQFYSTHIDGAGYVKIPLTEEDAKRLFVGQSKFSVQFWCKFDPIAQATNNRGIVFDVYQIATLDGTKSGSKYQLNTHYSGTTSAVGKNLDPDHWYHLNYVRNGSTVTIYVIDPSATKQSDLVYAKTFTGVGDGTYHNNIKDLVFGHSSTGGAATIDEIRLWSKALTKDEVLANYDHPLVGTELGLECYLPLDEGIASLKDAFDISKTGGVSNERHATYVGDATMSTAVPDQEYFSLYAKTDVDGNYVLRGVPFSGSGTNYNVIPSKGIHKFSPTKQSRYVSASSLNFSAVDFDDVSSFPVSGYVYYSNTEYPVEGAQLYVDGTVCSKDGKVLTTDANGRFEIAVPIGDHHITVEKNGHTFENDGRYPADPNNTGTKFTFNQEVKDLTFYDNTTVRVVGRVAGGVIQQDEPIGMKQGKANMGQAKITLEVPRYRFNVEKVYSADSTSYSIETATKDRELEAVTNNVNSIASVGHANDDQARVITILTDAENGEFAVNLPPIAYDVKKVEIPTNNTVTFNSGDLAVLDVSDTSEGKDSLEVDGKMQYFYYDMKRNFIYRSTPRISVTNKDDDSTFFGEKTYSAINNNGTKEAVNLQNENGTYRFGYPIFVQENTYQFEYYGYEEYVNNDGTEGPVTDKVPMQGVEITIQNQFAGTTSVSVGQNGSYADGDIAESEDNVLTLDSEGRATYTFTAGFPNIKGDHTMSLSASYAINGVSKDMEPMKAIVFGILPTGNNFTTAGPDQILYVLRDPPGTHSYAYVEEGTTFECETSQGGTWSTENEVTTVSHLGFSETFLIGGIGLMKQTTVESKADLTVGLQVTDEGSTKDVTKHSVTTTQRIQTSDEDQFVGANGDVFIGSGTNIIFGKMRKVQPFYSQDDNQWNVDMRVETCTGQQFATNFFYTTQQIENSILPNYEDMIAEVLQPMGTEVSLNPAKPVYVSNLPADDPNFGKSNVDTLAFGSEAMNKWNFENHTLEGPSYNAYYPADMEVLSDTITWINSQIDSWKQTLANNEMVKVNAKNSGKLKNVSFDSGVVVERSYSEEDYDGIETENTFKMSLVAGFDTGVEINKTGVDISLKTNTGGGHVTSHSEGTTQSKSVGFVLADEGEDDKHTIDYGMGGDGYGYVFFTLGGQTSCPYEDVEVTKYYKPGTVLSSATAQIQVPKIRAEKTIVSNIPTAGTGEVTLLLSNDSEINEDGYYDLSLVDETNPDGLQFFMDGQPFAGGRSVYVSADTIVTRKTIMVKQGKKNVLKYKDVKLRLSSQCQGDPSAAFPVIADTLALTFEFAPSCSDIELAVDNKTVNNMTGPQLALTISKYDLNLESLKGIKIQYMKGGNDWALAKEYVTKEADATTDKELLKTAEATYTLDMSDPVWSDGNYVFRAITVCDNAGDIVNNESNEINVVKDMAQPMLIAMPTPTNGILNAGDELSVTFNEDIQYGELVRTANFYIRGQLNDRQVDHDATFQANGTAGASTEAAIDLAGKSFAVNLWLNWNEAGSFVNHGSQDNSFDAAVDANGHLVVTVDGVTYTSDATIPKDKWNFVSLSMEQTENGAVLNANAAYDGSEVTLFQNKSTGAYTGNGKFEVGKSVKGAIHEVTLWNEARAWAVAQGEMYTGKSPFTPALIGYWRMDEAHGTTAEDAARHRHILLPSENAWHMENVNNSLQLDGTDYVDISIGSITTDNTQDYAVELWMRADETQAGDASIISMGNNSIDLRIAQSGALELEAKGTTYNVTTTDLRDNQWHHIALNVLKSTNGMATVYVDGSQLKQIPASSMPALANDNLVLGAKRYIETPGTAGTFSQYLKGNFDELRIWHSTMTGDMLRQNMYARVNPADYDGLVAYYPMEKRTLDQYNQIVTNSTLADQAQGSQAIAKVLCNGASVAEWSSSEAKAMKLAPTTQNVDFSFVGSDRKILITLNETPSRVEGCTLYFTVRSVRDMNGNLSDPITWTAVVNRHQMEWSEETVSVRKANAESKTFEVDVRNVSASTTNWTITGMPSWLSASAESGTLAAQGSKTITFTVAASTAVGKYEQTIYVSGDDGVQKQLVVNLVSEGETPDWTVNPAGYEFTMNVMGQLKIDNKLSEDTEDIVAAFNGKECVGVARPQYLKRYDAYYVMMTIYGNDGDDNDNITFKVYDASTGITYPSVGVSQNVNFEKDAVVGSIESPIIWTPDNKVEQDIALSTGWNWISLYVEPEDKTIGNMLKDVNVAQVKTSRIYAQHTSSSWAGELTEMALGTMYKMQASEDGELQVMGTPVVSSETPINVSKGWNWLGVATTATLSPGEAFGGLAPKEGDLVKSQREFSMFSGNDWVGSLEAIVPGVGYLYSSEDATTKSFTYPAKGSTQGRRNAPRRASAALDGSPIELLENNMNVILTVIDENGQQRDDAIIRVSAYGQLRGEALAPNYESEYFLTVQGKADDAEMQVSVLLDGITYEVGTILFQQDALYGSVKQPVVLVIGESTAISPINIASYKDNGSVYDLGGRRVSSEKLSNGQLNKGIYIYDHQKVVK